MLALLNTQSPVNECRSNNTIDIFFYYFLDAIQREVSCLQKGDYAEIDSLKRRVIFV